MSLLALAVRRALWTVPLILAVMLVTFGLMYAAEGSPFEPPEGFSGVPLPLQKDLEDFYHLDEPWYVEYAVYVRNVFTFRFGPSLVGRNLSVDDVIRHAMPVTLQLIGLAVLVAVPLGFALGVLGALRRKTATDVVSTTAATTLLVLPIFFIAYALSQYVVLEWRLLPSGWDEWRARLLPTLALSLAPIGYIARLVRGAVAETLQSDYVRTARSKGLRASRIVLVHVVPNSLVPVLSAAVPMLVLLITGALFVETYFGIPGASARFLFAAQTRDYPMIMGLTVALTAIVLVANLLADVAMAALDPRLRERR